LSVRVTDPWGKTPLPLTSTFKLIEAPDKAGEPIAVTLFVVTP